MDTQALLFEKNLSFLGSKSSLLKNRLQELKQNINIIKLSEEDSPAADYEIRVSGSTEYNAFYIQCNDAYQSQISSPRRVLMQRIVGDSIGMNGELVLQETVGSEQMVLLNTLPCFKVAEPERTFSSSPLCPSFVLLGACSLFYIPNLLKEITLKTILLIESDFQQLCIALHFVDLGEIVESCKINKISFELLLNEKFAGENQNLPIILDTMANKQPRSVLGFNILKAPRLSPDMVQVDAWLTSVDGYLELAKGYLGNDTDEINQVMHSLYNALKIPSGYCLPKDLEVLDEPAILVASGPSLDASLEQLKSWQQRPTIIASGSSIRSLLKNQIVPDILVLLEQSWLVYHDLIEMSAEGFDLSSIFLVGSATLDPRVFNLFDQSCIFHRPLSSSLFLFPEEEYGVLPQAGPQAANAGLEVAMKLGFRKLMLLGCDFGAVDEEYQRSVDAMGTSPRNLSLPLLGSQGRTIYSSPELSVTRQLFERILYLYGARALCVGEGSRITGAESVTFEQAKKQFESNQLGHKIFEELKSKLSNRSVQKKELLSILSDCKHRCVEASNDFISVLSSGEDFADDFINLTFPFISWQHRSEKDGFTLYHRLTKFLYFFMIQAVVEDSNESCEQKKDSLRKSILLIRDAYLAYISFFEKLIGFNSLPEWDPLLVKSMLAREFKQLSNT